ncbi:MAG: L,D-transpeptidase family protein, partial [Bradymonadaceae bacterium]
EPTRVFVELSLDRFDDDLRRRADTLATGRALQEYIESETARPFRARVEDGLRYSTVFTRVYDAELPEKVLADSNGLNDRGTRILAVLLDSHLHALDSSLYHLERVQELDEKLKSSDEDLYWKPIEIAPDEAEALIQWLEKKGLDTKKAETWHLIIESLSRVPIEEGHEPASPLPRITDQIGEFLESYGHRAQVVAELELRLADGALRYARDMKHHNIGRYDWRDLRDAGGSTEVILSRLQHTFEALAEAELDKIDIIFADLEPPHPQYRRLLKARARYQAIVDAGGWSRVRPFDIELDTKNPRVPELRERLIIEGFLREEPASTPEIELEIQPETEPEIEPSENIEPIEEAEADLDEELVEEPPVYDPEVVDQALLDAFHAYQETHQFRVGKPTPGVWRSINVTAERRLAQIELSMNRWRDTLYDGEADYVFVNIPDFHAEVIEGHEQKMRFRVVVGNNIRVCDKKTRKWRYTNATPIQMANMDHMIINPSWYVPTRLVEESLRPNMRKDPNWFEDNGYEEIRMPGGRTAVRQKPGPQNALGLVKFIFPNPQNTYMHDTPQKHYFDFPVRGYSFGCVRVHTPLDFARYLLEFDSKTDEIDFDATIESGRTRQVKFDRELPVFTEYYTVRIDEEGRAHFLADIYRYDERDMSEDPDAWGDCTPGTRRRAPVSDDGSDEAPPPNAATDLGP